MLVELVLIKFELVNLVLVEFELVELVVLIKIDT